MISVKNLFLLGATCWLLPTSIAAQQSQTTQIACYNPSAPDYTPVSIGTNLPNQSGAYMDYTILAPFLKGKATVTFAHTAPAWVHIAGNAYVGTLDLFVAAQDSLALHLKENKKGGYYLSLKGKTAPIQELLLSRNLLSPQLYRIPNVLKTGIQYAEAKQLLDSYFNAINNTVDSVLQNTTSQYGKSLHAELDQVFLMALLLRLPTSNKLALQLLNNASQQWNPFQPQYAKTRYGFLNRELLLAKGQAPDSITKRANNLGLWPRNQEYRNHLSVPDQEHLYATEMAQDFYTSEQWDRERYLTRLRFFANVFPQSAYYTYLDKLILNRRDVDNAYLFGEYLDSARRFNYINRYPSGDLQEVIKQEFAGKPVLVDVWATYCSPCKSEFPYSASLQRWLAQQGIEHLYVSVDKAVNSAKWYAEVEKYNLSGFHYMLTFKGYNKLANLLSLYLTTPRYILFDAKGNIVDDKLPRPSDKDDALVKRIKELIPRLATNK